MHATDATNNIQMSDFEDNIQLSNAVGAIALPNFLNLLFISHCDIIIFTSSSQEKYHLTPQNFQMFVFWLV